MQQSPRCSGLPYNPSPFSSRAPPMNVFYEEDGGFKTGHVLVDNDSSLQVESPHGKRSKIKAANVLLRFTTPAAGELMNQADVLARDIDAGFLWECCGQEEFAFESLAEDYFGHKPLPAEAAAVAIRLHDSPMHFYKRGKGRYRAAPEESLRAALASVEKKRLQAEKVAGYVAQLHAGNLPDEFAAVRNMLLYKPDRNSLEVKALEQACAELGTTPVRLFERCGALPSSHDYHFQRFLFEHFPRGQQFPAVAAPTLPDDLPEADVAAFSIDDAATTEIDDAFSVRSDGTGGWRIGIHIAAPALIFDPDSTLDEIAGQRLSTVYMPGNKITMLPEALIAPFSLEQGSNRPAVSLYVDLAADGSISGLTSRVEKVAVAANLRIETLENQFNEASVAAGTTGYAYAEELLALHRFATQLEARRGKADQNRNFADFSFYVDQDRVRIVPRQRGTPIDKVVSELMILVNSEWGRMLAEQQIPGIYRSQTGGKVKMSTIAAPHQGLGVAHYAWSSSPLRRYVDLINQRQILAMIRNEPAPFQAGSEALFSAIARFDAAYDAYNSFQRHMENYWCLRYLQQEGIHRVTAEVVRENLVRFTALPYFTRVNSLPDLAPGDQIELEIHAMDLLDVHLSCDFRSKLDSPQP